MGGEEVVGEIGTWGREHPHCSVTPVTGEQRGGGGGGGVVVKYTHRLHQYSNLSKGC